MVKLNLTATINLQRPDKKGLYPVRIRQTVKRKVSYHSTGIMILEDQFESGIIVKHPNKVSLNAVIRNKIVEIEKNFIEGKVLKINSGFSPAFDAFCKAKIKQQKSRDSHGTWKHKNSYLKKVNTFRPSLRFNEITPSFMLDFENYCRGLGNKPTTVWSSIKFITTMINAAIDDKVITDNPKQGYKTEAYKNPERQFLTEEEIERIEKFASTSKNETLVKVANWFLFGCYSGLRYADVKNFSKKKVMNGRLILRTGKSLADVSIKLHPKLKAIIEKISPRVFTNQKLNEYLKIVAEKCDIEKNITFHTSRHTNAVYFLNHGGSMETLSKILGHSKIATTSIYGKITNLRIDKEIDKAWGKAK